MYAPELDTITIPYDEIEPEDSKTLHAVENDYCIICGKKNFEGLNIKYKLSQDGTIEARWTPSLKYEGFKGIIHGGILSAVIDEAMSKAIISRHIEALTVELNVRFHNYAVCGERLNIKAWIIKKHKRKILTEGILFKENGDKILHAMATFLTL